ncbi:hypothetical protein LX15_005362 [Streptoalloteichus tenebrarius]|uniref:Uncharacterized protein n=1 Tax=Streptoalloteichus tenebrarius (strain ATCC 17920 / DSM 40477 / JCM 4838 / CBS 697.72 / NBRC 16177 / NCIMB 11028 / NRRL B-12390 / A12253. 1 / ISP 5477) TaxID=1933 RepID=A0ABT1I1G8_STRSD|nr:hypothetical protein [Streptoalloteichus tenebrarius]MCP2261636.1 hypothetical protein [Streptoalloteichus tenebrarius]BFE99362.1 hypothetical protein GCM10020241_10380 [Streptoalloteichus tenebrarius]
MTFRVRRPRWLTALVGVTLAFVSAGVPAAAETNAEAPPTECGGGWCREALPQDPLPLGISAMTMVGGRDVWAVGTGRFGVPLTLRWDGMSWQSVPAPDANVDLFGMAGWSRNDVWAVGFEGSPGSETRSFTQHWNGREWKVVPSPNPADFHNDLRAVAAAGPNDVWAVGGTVDRKAGNRPLLLHWDGQEWSVVPTPLSDVPGTFQTVYARSPHDVWVGGLADGPVALHWDGRTWQRTDVPEQDPMSTIAMGADLDGRPLLAVSRVVGKYQHRTHLWHWTGSEWRKLSVPAVDGRNLTLTMMAGNPTGRVWLAGKSGFSGVVLEWDGREWTRNALAGGGQGAVHGLAVSPGGREVWAGGSFRVGGGLRGMIFARR